jgi:hypothetical protein
MGSFEIHVIGGNNTYCWGFYALGAHYIDNGFTADKVLLSASFTTKSPHRSLRSSRPSYTTAGGEDTQAARWIAAFLALSPRRLDLSVRVHVIWTHQSLPTLRQLCEATGIKVVIFYCARCLFGKLSKVSVQVCGSSADTDHQDTRLGGGPGPRASSTMKYKDTRKRTASKVWY